MYYVDGHAGMGSMMQCVCVHINDSVSMYMDMFAQVQYYIIYVYKSRLAHVKWDLCDLVLFFSVLLKIYIH